MVYYRSHFYNNKYAVIMQPDEKKLNTFKTVIGKIFEGFRKSTGKSQRKFADEFDIDRGNLSKLERGIICCNLITAWKIAEATGIKFSEFAKLLEDELGDDFKLMDE